MIRNYRLMLFDLLIIISRYFFASKNLILLEKLVAIIKHLTTVKLRFPKSSNTNF